MADSNITVSNLVLNSAVGMLVAKWSYNDPNADGLTYLRLDTVELWAGTTNNRVTSASLVATGIISAIHAGIAAGSTWFFWIRARDRSGQYGDWFPSSPTAGIKGVEGATGTLTAGLIRTAASGLRVEISGHDNQIKFYKSGASLPYNILGAVGGEENASDSATFNCDSPFNNISAIYASVSGGGKGIYVATTPSASSLAQPGLFDGSAGIGGGVNFGVSSWAATGQHAFFAWQGNYGPFTGSHEGFLAKDAEIEIGDVLTDDFIFARKDISNAVAVVKRSAVANQRAVIGVIASRRPIIAGDATACMDKERLCAQRETYDLINMNAVGEGQINVCGDNGPITAGDLLVASSVPGKAMKQDDDVVRSYTVARARESADVGSASDRAQIACVYLCG